MKSPVHSTLDIWCSSKLICQHLGYTRDLIFWRDDQRDHACSIPKNKIQHEQKIQQSIEYQSMLVICSRSTDQQKDIKMLSNSKQGCSLQSHLPKGRDSSIYATNLGKYITFFKDMFGKFFCHLQFWFVQSTKLTLKCVTKCWLDKTNSRNRSMNAITRKVSINVIKLIIKCRLLPLNVNSFYDFKLESCGSMIWDA